MRLSTHLRTGICAFVVLGVGCTGDPAGSVSGDLFADTCARCHGAKGGGDIVQKTPSIGGQPEWYILQQLQKFRVGQRGEHPDDKLGNEMRDIALALKPEQLEPLARRISAMDPWPTKSTLPGDPKNGRLVYEESCMECHRYNGQGEMLFRSSPLTTFQDWYLVRELEEFRKGLRGHHPDDADGAKMAEIMPFVSKKDVRDVVAYIATLAASYPPGD